MTNFVASSEYISSHFCDSPESIIKLRNELSKIFSSIKIIIYIREQISWIKSFYCQSVKGPSRSRKTFTEFISEMDDYKSFWDYYSLCREWSDTFGINNISITLFDKRCLLKEDLIHDFSHKINTKFSPQENIEYPRLNVSPTFKQIQILRKLNEFQVNPTFWDPSIILRGAVLRTGSLFFDKFPTEYDSIIRSKISISNRKVNETFLKKSLVLLPV